MKKDGNQKIYTKDEIMEELNHYLELQSNIVTEKEKEYYQFEKEKENDGVYNPHQKELNNQIKAYANTAQTIVRIYNSNLENFDEDGENESKELVD